MSIGVVGLFLVFTAGCIDTQRELDSFSERIVDAAVNTTPDAPPVAEIPDITGEFLLGLDPVIAPGSTLQFIATVEFWQTDTESFLNIEVRPLDRNTRELVPDGDVISDSDVPVSNSAEFSAELAGPIPGEANPISGSDLMVETQLNGIIRTVDLFCGLVEGMETNLNLDLDGSTFAAIRITPGTRGEDLPDVVPACPELPPDAGMAADATAN